jgi:hypothetical protein
MPARGTYAGAITSPASATQAELDSIVARFSASPERAKQDLRDWFGNDPATAMPLAVRSIGRNPGDPASGFLALLVIGDQRYIPWLTNPASLPRDEAFQAARVFSVRDVRFFVSLAAWASDSLSQARLMYILDLVEDLGATNVMTSWLVLLARSCGGKVRQRAVRILCQAGANPLFVDRELRSEDPRVRANAVEGLWSASSGAARSLLEQASHDKNHRVAANALLGLFLQGDAGAIERMIEMTRASSPHFRGAAAWALGQTGHAKAWSALQALLKDRDTRVREAAERWLTAIPRPSEAGPDAPATVPRGF